MLLRLKSFIHRRLPNLAFLLFQIRFMISQRASVRIPDIDDQSYERPRLLIDVTQTSSAPFLSGIQRVVLRLTHELIGARQRLPFEPVLVRLQSSDGKLELVRAVEFEARVAPTGPHSSEKIKIRRYDVLFMLDSSWTEFAYYEKAVFPAVKSVKGLVITCLYDLIPITNPEFCVRHLVALFSRWMVRMLRSSDAILCISRTTKDSLERHLAMTGRRFHGEVGYFHLGSDFGEVMQSTDKKHDDIPTVLMVGTLEPRKGYEVAFKAFQKLWRRGEPIRLHIVGRFGWSVEALVADMKSDAAYGDLLVLDTAATDAELRQAYCQADLVLSASYAEGFGLPLVEAAAFGKSLMVSDIPAYLEICGSNAIYFRTGDAGDLASKLDEWMNRRPAIQPPKFITWSESCQQLVHQISVSVDNQTRRARTRTS